MLFTDCVGVYTATRVWNQTFDAVLKKIGFRQSETYSCLYVRKKDNRCSYLIVYVDDMVVACESEEEYEAIIRELNKSFQVTSLGDIH